MPARRRKGLTSHGDWGAGAAGRAPAPAGRGTIVPTTRPYGPVHPSGRPGSKTRVGMRHFGTTFTAALPKTELLSESTRLRVWKPSVLNVKLKTWTPLSLLLNV